MKNNSTDKNRRAVLKGMFAIPVVAFAGFQSTAHAEMLSPSDPTAQALGYVSTSATDGQSCSTCSLFSAPTGDAGNCAIFPGKQVSKTGWCKSYVAKP